MDTVFFVWQSVFLWPWMIAGIFLPEKFLACHQDLWALCQQHLLQPVLPVWAFALHIPMLPELFSYFASLSAL